MKHPFAVFLAILAVFFGIRGSYLLSDGAHYLAHQGSFDAVIAFVLIFLAPCPFLLSVLIAIFVWSKAIEDDDQSLPR